MIDTELLKEKVLDLAMRGELVDENSQEWHEFIFGDLVTIRRGGSPRPIRSYLTRDIEGINWIKISDTIPGEKYITQTQEKIIKEGLNKSRAVSVGDFLLSNSMSYGRPYILKIDGAIHDGWLAISKYENFFDKDFLFYLLSSPYVKKQFELLATGSTVKNLNIERVSSIKVLLPPLNLQKDTVLKIEEIFNRIDQLEEEQEKINHFKHLIQAKVLQLAMQGKLVPQLPEEGTAANLLEEVEVERQRLIDEKKIKKDKPLPEISEDEIPYDIPESWEWVRLGDILIEHVGGGTPSKKVPEYWGGDIPWCSIKDFHGDILTKTIDAITEEGLNNSSSNLIKRGNLIVATRLAVGKIMLTDIDVAINQDLRALIFGTGVNKAYIRYIYGQLNFVTQGVTVKGININNLLSILIPLPPLKEQERIAKKLDEINQVLHGEH